MKQQTMVVLPGEQFKEELAQTVAEMVLASIGGRAVKGPENDDLLTTKEVLALWRISAPTLRKWRKQGLVKAYGAGTRHHRYRRSEVEEALAKM